MPTVTKNFQLYQGEDVVLPDTIYQPDGVTPQNVTGWAVQFTLHALAGATDPPTPVVVKKTVGAGIVLTTPLAGLLTISLAAADTAALAPGPYLYRVERTDAGLDAVLTAGVLTLLLK